MTIDKKIAERLKAARSMAGYAERKAFGAKFDIPLATLEAWERGKNPLTLKGARRIVQALKSVGVYSSEEWLMTGKGFSPRPLEEISVEFELDSPHSLKTLEKNLKIAKELSTFTTLNDEAIVTIIRDDLMLPFYAEGDYVGGVKLPESAFHKALDRRCIVEFPNGQTTVRYVSKGKDFLHYNISAINKNAKATPMTTENVKVASVAPIIWHRAFHK
ncbi:MAG: helix-turn-helix transcriptional regulator [Proteobacteria bacterium]|nr:helix-turn-helix transcriptional regulator [Pseudomonadota bacterium]